jgi:FMN phosphatase YigB (HAD superfamily)
MINKPSMVVFDFDDTLYSYAEANTFANDALIRLGSELTGSSHEEFAGKFAKARESVKARLGQTGSSHSRLLYIHEALSTLGFSNQPSIALILEQEYWRNYLLAMNLREGAEDLLLTLRFNHIPISLVTDLTLGIQLRKLTYLKLESFFDVVVASEETQRDKVSLLPFDLMISRSKPEWLENVWFIGDGFQDAPIEAMIGKEQIKSGVGWIKGVADSENIFGWSSLTQIEFVLEKTLNSLH